MPHLIDKAAVVAEIEKRRKEAESNCGGYKSYDEHRCNDCTVEFYNEFLEILNTLEVKEVDLDEEIESYFKGFGKYPSVGIDDCIDIAKHFFELGMRLYNPITAADRGIAEEIIINLKRVEQDYRINLTREIEWLKSRVKKGE